MIKLKAILLLLPCKNASNIYKELRKVVDQAVESGKLSDFPAVQLPLFKATINEALRLQAGVGFAMPRVMDQTKIELSGLYIPPG
ncbi:uncharacterized protein BDW43DRAFT_294890 [Aspergillus alliaceus]|uniref:uncharacterized protein n=1 Tax=Petromyces alliaceus TaxID=209559 RepID=UPI0012A4D467|nr:uncharacterized protein BDW43DRAFT_294890 [Aspergillus alliaceus]KAB8227097.1 hypothetical protein BDW43DRAFT_294890 [Aspergillus alliaceus]